MYVNDNIVNIIKNILPNSRIILFGSRANKKNDSLSDYDFLLISKNNYSLLQRRMYERRIRKALAESNIPADIIIQTEKDVKYYINKNGSIINIAMNTGIEIK